MNIYGYILYMIIYVFTYINIYFYIKNFYGLNYYLFETVTIPRCVVSQLALA